MILQSRKSVSGTTKHRRQRVLLKRKPRVRQTTDADLRYLWAAYQQGIWDEVMASHLSTAAFEEKVLDLIGAVPFDWILEAPGDSGMHPVGLILAEKLGVGIEPFVEWFPWATPRNQMEATAAFLREISKQFKIFVFAPEEAETFWTAFVQYGMIRRGCKVIDYFSRGEHALLYYTVFK